MRAALVQTRLVGARDGEMLKVWEQEGQEGRKGGFAPEQGDLGQARSSLWDSC